MSFNLVSTIWWLQVFISLMSPVLSILVGISIAVAIPFCTAILFLIFLVSLGYVHFSRLGLIIFSLYIAILSSTILNAPDIRILASLKTFGYLPAYFCLFYFLIKHIATPRRILLIDRTFYFFLSLSLMMPIELLSRLYLPLQRLIHSYFIILNTTSLAYLSSGAVSGIFKGTYVLGFFGDISTSVGLAVITGVYFFMRSKNLATLLSIICVISSISASGYITFFTSLFIIGLARKSIKSFRQAFVILSLILVGREFIMPSYNYDKFVGHSFRTTFGDFLSGLNDLDLNTFLFGSGYLTQGAFGYGESALVEYIYSTGILCHLIPLIMILYCFLMKKDVYTPTSDRSTNIAVKVASPYNKYLLCTALYLMYLGLTFHYNMFYNPVVPIGFCLILLTKESFTRVRLVTIESTNASQ